MTARPVAQSLFPDHQPDRPVGPIPGSVQRGTNADLIATIAPLYLTGTVLDVTYGQGGWWKRYKPADFTAHDLYTLDGVDFRALPEPDNSIDTVCFDPPYVPQGGMSSSTADTFRDRFGLTIESQPWWECFDLMAQGLKECARVTRRWVLVKCSDFVTGGKFTLGSLHMMNTGLDLGLGIHDVIVHHTGSGPGGHNIWEPIRTRRHHSYLIVFTPKMVYS
jgi:hypothetical protein